MKGKNPQYNRYCTILSLLTCPFPNFEPEEFQFLCPLESLCKAPNSLGSTPELLPDSEHKKNKKSCFITSGRHSSKSNLLLYTGQNTQLCSPSA